MRPLAWLALLVLLASPAHAAGVATVTTGEASKGVVRYSIAWTATAGGAVSANAFYMEVGRILQVKFVPAAGGDAPTAAYDVTLADANGIDLMSNAGANLSATAAAMYVYSAGAVNDSAGTVDLVVADAGNAKKGTVVIWLQRM